jgi:endonuclease/exonuclease/phosphatase family metal-dependent hydrolase
MFLKNYRMKKYFIFFLLLFAIIQFSFGQPLDVMTYNIKYDNPNDGENSWENRKKDMAKLLEKYHPQVIGTQEGLYHQLTYLDSCLTDYSFAGVGRKDGKNDGEFSAIFYDSTKITILSQNTFWLSETGDTASIGWDAALERICTYALFEWKKSKQKFWVFNAHFDHVGETARTMSAGLILKKVEEVNSKNLPLIVMGDLNSEPSSEAIVTFNSKLQDGRAISEETPSGPFGTYNDFKTEVTEEKRIDYIFVSGIKVISYKHIDDRKKNGYQISDHFPALMKATFNN